MYIFDFTRTSVPDCLVSKNPLLRMLGVLSEKAGIKKVKSAIKEEHPLVSYMAMFRYDTQIEEKNKKRET